MSVQHHRPAAVLAAGQTWCVEGQPDRTIIEVFAETVTAGAAVRVSMPHPVDRTVVMTVRAFRAWIKRYQATKKDD
jgi:hypothetical protein